MLMVGLTGGIGSGKSTVARHLAAWGAVVIDADQIAREIVAVGQPALAEIVERFGTSVLDGQGALDRQALADIVFHDDDARRDLEAITHPRIGATIAERIAEVQHAEAAGADERIVVLDHPLLVESGAASQYPVVVVVTAPAEVRVARLVEQRGMGAEDARARIRAQADDQARIEAATHVIDNGGSVEELLAQVTALLDDLRERAVE